MMRCEVCRDPIDMTAHSDWEGGMCDKCWARIPPITRGWFALIQRRGEEEGWSDRYVTEHNVQWDMMVNMVRQSYHPPPPRKQFDPRKAKVDFSKVGRPRAAQLMRERQRRR